MHIYLDNAATTPVSEQVLHKTMPYFNQKFGNPNSLHSYGIEAKKAIVKSTQDIAEHFGCLPQEIIYTSGATESNNLAISGLLENYNLKNKKKPHIISSAIEHPSVLNLLKKIESQKLAEVDFVNPNASGLIEVNDVIKKIKENTILISIMYANNEIGTIQPIQKLGKEINLVNQNRQEKIYFHSDVVQAVQYINFNVKNLHLDMFSMSGHKIYGLKGSGILYLKKGTPLSAQIIGGEQQSGLRSGTLNVTGIISLATAIAELKKINIQKIKKMRDELQKNILKNIPRSFVNGDGPRRLPNILNITFEKVEGESLMLALSNEGIAVSTGSACSSESLKSSHVLSAIGLPAEKSHGSLRFSLGKNNSLQQIKYTAGKVQAVVEKFRKIAPEF